MVVVFSCWKNIDRIENTEHLNLLEESLRKSIVRIQIHKVCQFIFLSTQLYEHQLQKRFQLLCRNITERTSFYQSNVQQHMLKPLVLSPLSHFLSS